jgi:hypothetical protein
MNQRPFWYFLPYINNRTAWKPIGFPSIFIIPFGVDGGGNVLSRTQPSTIEVSVLDNVTRNKVAGHQNLDLFFPDRELFTVRLSSREIRDRMIEIGDFESDKDWVYIINRNGLRGRIPNVINGLYYDLSDVMVDVENLSSGRYQLSYKAIVGKRVYDNNDSIICIKDNEVDSIYSNVDFVHPGEIIEQFKKNTPSIWFSNVKLSEEPIFKIYKPITDCLQNVYDEQNILARLNFVNSLYPETTPYLSRILGWDIPYFPKSLDSLRTNILRYTTYLQKNRGTLKAVNELFQLFGFEVLISNLWFDIDNSDLVSPSYDSDKIGIEDIEVTDILESGLISPGFYQNRIPLVSKPSVRFEDSHFVRIYSDIELIGFTVDIGGDAHNDIDNIIKNDNLHLIDQIEGFRKRHTVVVDKDGNISSEYFTNRIINSDSIKINFLDPSVEFSLSGHWNDDNEVIYLFARYRHQSVRVSSELLSRRSNYFDIKLVEPIDSDSLTGLVLDYVLEFLYRIKAFHSLLRKFLISLELEDAYLVTDYCYGPNLSELPQSDAGKQQVPPAIDPGDIEECSDVRPYKDIDYIYRTRLLRNLIEEYNAYLKYDDREFKSVVLGALQLQYPDLDRAEGYYNEYGQDIFKGGYEVSREFGYIDLYSFPNNFAEIKPIEYFDYSFKYFNADSRDMNFSKYSMIDLYTNTVKPDSLFNNSETCFKGRVEDNFVINLTSILEESYSNSSCDLVLGNGTYFITVPGIFRYGVENRQIGSKSNKPIYSDIDRWSSTRPQSFGENRRVGINSSRISNQKSELHYTDRNGGLEITWGTLADKSVSMEIQKTNMHFPGTRFVSMSGLREDFVSVHYKLRPWDIDICDERNDQLNTRLEYIDENQYIIFEQLQYIIEGNGQYPDIPNMSNHIGSVINQNEVVHKIYSQHISYWDTDIEQCDYSDVIVTNGDNLFRKLCDGTDGDNVDYLVGYPALTGFVQVEIESGVETFLFLMNSGIKDGSRGYRMLCGEYSEECGDINNFNAANMDNNDIDIKIKSNLDEVASFSEISMDGYIGSMLELI